MKKLNNWYALSGVASSGKTTIINLLEKKGYRVLNEAATEFVKLQIEKGYTVHDLRKDESGFQKIILDLKLFYEGLLDSEELTFIDRGIPDTVAFYKQYNIPMTDSIKKSIEDASYKKVFVFERLPLVNEDFRPEPEEEIAAMDRYNLEAYEKLGHNIVKVPVMAIEDRLNFVLAHL